MAIGDLVAYTSINGSTEVFRVDGSGNVSATGTVDAGSAGFVGDIIAESTAASGVTVDGCLIKDGRAAALATAGMFFSAEVTGNGSEQSTAHGLGAAPSLCFAFFTELTGGAADIASGTHTATNALFTVTSGEKYRIVAFK